MKKLTYEQIKRATFGAVKVAEKDGQIEFYRFTEKQEKFNRDNPDNVRVNELKSFSTTSVKLEFYSDTQKIYAKINAYLSTGQKPCFIDLYIDDELFLHEGYSDTVDGQIIIDAKLKVGRKKITLYFCNLFICKLVNLSISDGAYFLPVTEGQKYLFLGDSITQGYTTEYPSESYPNALARAFGAHALNQAIGGAVFNADMLDNDLGFIPDKVFIAYGTNDWCKTDCVLISADAYVKRVIELFPNSEIIVLTPIWRGDLGENEKRSGMTFLQLQENLKKVYSKYSSVKVVDGYLLVPHDKKYFIEDVLHPNEYGFREYFKNLYKAL